jgi:Predicted signal transduction protein with a C-terminal ATPase domain
MKRLKFFSRYIFDRAIWFAATVLFLQFIIFIVLIVLLSPHVNFLYIVTSLLIMYSIILYVAYRFIYVPYEKTKKIMNLVSTGYTFQGLFELPYSYDSEMDALIARIRELLNSNKLISDNKRQAQYLALQNQINPHFLYNTLEGIRGEALCAGLETVAQMTEALATFFRYTISNLENLVTVEEELENVKNYVLIQQYRFDDRFKLHINCDEEDEPEIKKCRLPKLTLQPIVENAIIHGIERKLGIGNISIKMEFSSSRLLITISDDGIGMDEETLIELVKRLNFTDYSGVDSDNDRKGGIAIVNVNNRIKLLFGEQYGINIYSIPNVCTDVEIFLPRVTSKAINEVTS